jgi:hypothetical protein
MLIERVRLRQFFVGNVTNYSNDEVKKILNQIAEAVTEFAHSAQPDEKKYLVYQTYHPKITLGSEHGIPVRYEPGPTERIPSFKRESRIRIQDKIKETHQKLVDIIGSVFQGDGVLGAFNYLDHLLKHPENKDEISRIALEEILQVPTDWNCIVFLNGLVCRRSYKINGIIIRPPKATDFKLHRVLLVENTRPNIPLEVREGVFFVVSSVLEFVAHNIPRGFTHTFFDNYGALLSAIENEIDILRLSVGGRWKYSSWYAKTNQVLFNPLIDNRLPYERYLLKLGILEYSYFKEKEKDMYSFVRNQLYPKYMQSVDRRSKKLLSPLRALKMLNEAAQRPPLESILFSIIGLEAILQREPSEMRLKLSTRTAILLECLGYSRSKVFDDVYESYKIRNEFVHGDTVDEKKASDKAPKLLEYLRLAILMWLDSDCKTSKEEQNLHTNLERASMQEEKLEEISNRFKTVIARFGGLDSGH